MFLWHKHLIFIAKALNSRMHSEGSRFTLGVWGLSVCSLDVAFVVATVRNRPQPSATASFRMAGVALRDFRHVL